MRITEPTIADLSTYCLTNNIQAVIGGYEHINTDNQHYHVLVDIDVKKDSFIKALKSKSIILKGNQSYKCRVVLEGTEHKVARYAAKSSLYQSTDKTYTKDWILKNPYDWSLKDNTVKKSDNFAAVLITQWKIHKQTNLMHPNNYETECIDWCVKYFMEKVKIFDKFIIRRFVNLCLATTNLHDAQMRMRRLLHED